MYRLFVAVSFNSVSSDISRNPGEFLSNSSDRFRQSLSRKH